MSVHFGSKGKTLDQSGCDIPNPNPLLRLTMNPFSACTLGGSVENDVIKMRIHA
jgi:hypothetical protein